MNDPADDWRTRLAEALVQLESARMPFGRYGPDNFPPRGVPLIDLPAEYLAYFERRGFPKGRLGELMRVVYHVKMDGADRAFEPLRKRNGGRTRLIPSTR